MRAAIRILVIALIRTCQDDFLFCHRTFFKTTRPNERKPVGAGLKPAPSVTGLSRSIPIYDVLVSPGTRFCTGSAQGHNGREAAVTGLSRSIPIYDVLVSPGTRFCTG